MNPDEAEKGYTWESEYERTWEALQEDTDGSLQASINDIIRHTKRKQLLQRPANVRLGMMRHLFIVVDASEAMQDKDLRPNRLVSTLKLLEGFVDEFFDQNPISQLGIITTKNKRAVTLTQLAGNPSRHLEALRSFATTTCESEPSLQNSLLLAAQTLRHVPGHASREILVIFGSLTTCDPSNILDTIKMLKEANIRCSVISLAAEVCIFRRLCQKTQGSFHVILDETHFIDLLRQQATPPPAAANTEWSLIKMGFPQFQTSTHSTNDKPALCMCHLDSKEVVGFGSGGYFCPQCHSKYCELPVECRACSLTLVSAPHLARSYHHLFPVDPYEEVNIEMEVTETQRFCCGCQKFLSDPVGYRCSKCQRLFCMDCNIFAHDSLHSCPGCTLSRCTQQISS